MAQPVKNSELEKGQQNPNFNQKNAGAQEGWNKNQPSQSENLNHKGDEMEEEEEEEGSSTTERAPSDKGKDFQPKP